MIGNLALSLESVEVRMSQLAKNEVLYGRHFSFDEMVAMIQSITHDDFVRVAERIFKEKSLSLISLGGGPGTVSADLRL
jgi:predicted Zn-dependent peptidase